MKPIKQIVTSYNGTMIALTEAGEIYQQERDRQHSGPGEPRFVWKKIEGPPE